MKKLLLSSLLLLGMGNALFASNLDESNIKIKINKIFEKTNKVMSKIQNNKINFNVKRLNYDKKIGVYFGIEELSSKNNKGYIFFIYYPKGNIVQIIQPNNLKLLTDSKKVFYISPEIRKTVYTFYRLNNDLKKQQIEKQKKLVFEKLKDGKNSLILLSKDINKPLLLLFIDPNCPYCIQKVKSPMFKLLVKKFNVGIVLTPLVTLDKNNNVIKKQSLHPNALKLAVNIQSKIKSSMKQDEKIKIIKEFMKNYNDNNFKTINDELAKRKILENYNDFIKTNIIKGTPTLIIYKDKTKIKTLFNLYK